MKKFNLLTLVAILSLFLSSCNSEETLLPQDENTDLLKSYKIKKDVEGNYSLDFDLNDDTAIDKIEDKVTNTKNFYLYSEGNKLIKKVTEDLVINGEELTVGFVDTRSNKNPSITIIDDKISFAKTNEAKFLKEYSIEATEDGNFLLNFTVNNGVLVDFLYNKDSETYEIQLKEGKGVEQSFSKVLTKEEGKSLKFDFVNLIKINELAKSSKSVYSRIEKPRGIII